MDNSGQRRPDGAARASQEAVASQLSENGKRVQARSLDTDVRRLQRAMVVAEAGVWEWDIASDRVELSDILRSITGIPLERISLALCEFMALVHAQDRPMVEAELRKTLESRTAHEAEFRIVRSDGRTRWVVSRGAGEYDEQGTPLRIIGVTNDVTERKLAQIALQQSEERFRTLVEATATIVWLANSDGSLKHISQTFERYTGAKVEEGLGAGWLAAIHPDDREHTLAVWGKAIATGENYETEFRLRRVDGVYRYFYVEGASLCAADGKVREWIGIVTDIDDRKQAEARLEELHKQLADSSRLAGMAQIATNVLHNVGNVLNSVNVSASLVADRVTKSKISGLTRVTALLRKHEADLATFIGSDPKGKLVPGYLSQLAEHLRAEQGETLKELDSLRENIDHIKRIVAMQQNYAKRSDVFESVNLVDLVEDSLRLNEASRDRHRIAVHRQFETVPSIRLDKHKVLQILVNLLSNAKQACDDSGRTDKQVTVQVANVEGGIKVSVIDNGVGIPAENLARIFNYAFTTRKLGHGFGLHSAALAAKELGGSLTAHSDGPGKGATFTFEVPLGAAKHP